MHYTKHIICRYIMTPSYHWRLSQFVTAGPINFIKGPYTALDYRYLNICRYFHDNTMSVAVSWCRHLFSCVPGSLLSFVFPHRQVSHHARVVHTPDHLGSLAAYFWPKMALFWFVSYCHFQCIAPKNDPSILSPTSNSVLSGYFFTPGAQCQPQSPVIQYSAFFS